MVPSHFAYITGRFGNSPSRILVSLPLCMGSAHGTEDLVRSPLPAEETGQDPLMLKAIELRREKSSHNLPLI